MTCCHHALDDHGPAGCCWCRCKVTRDAHAERAEVDALGDWRCTSTSRMARWLNGPAWTTPPDDASRPGPIAGEIAPTTPAQEAWLQARIDRLKAEVDKHYWTYTRCVRGNPLAMMRAHAPLAFARRVLARAAHRRRTAAISTGAP